MAPGQTVARSVKPASAHWYRITGEPLHEVQKADGKGMRKTTLADARKLNLLPSVTGIIKLLHAEGLVRWRIEQACLAVLTAPRPAEEALDDFVNRVLNIEEQQDQEAKLAREKGTAIHDALNLYYEGSPVPANMQPYIAPAVTAINAFGARASSEVILIGDDYGGVTDLIQDCEGHWRVWDAKSTKRLPDPRKGGAWMEHRLQISAYAKAFQNKLILAGTGLKPIICANIYISSDNPGEYVICEIENWEETYEKGFAPLLMHWQWQKGYRPQNPKRMEQTPAPTGTDPQVAQELAELKASLGTAKSTMTNLSLELETARQALHDATGGSAEAVERPEQTVYGIAEANNKLIVARNRIRELEERLDSSATQSKPTDVPAAKALPTHTADGRKIQWSTGTPTPVAK